MYLHCCCASGLLGCMALSFLLLLVLPMTASGWNHVGVQRASFRYKRPRPGQSRNLSPPMRWHTAHQSRVEMIRVATQQQLLLWTSKHVQVPPPSNELAMCATRHYRNRTTHMAETCMGSRENGPKTPYFMREIQHPGPIREAPLLSWTKRMPLHSNDGY